MQARTLIDRNGHNYIMGLCCFTPANNLTQSRLFIACISVVGNCLFYLLFFSFQQFILRDVRTMELVWPLESAAAELEALVEIAI